MNENFEFLLSEFGKPADPVFLTDEELSVYRGRLPDSLLEFWRQVGLGAWGNGLFQFCQPADYSSIVQTIFRGDPEIDSGDCSVIGYEAFCQLHIWHRALGKMKVDLLFAEIVADFTRDAQRLEIDRKLGPDKIVAISLSNVLQYGDIMDEDGTPMFERAVAVLGAPQRDECFGFVPALGLGGARRLEYLRRVRAPEHFTILAGLNRFRLVTLKDLDMVTVRMIGD